MSSLIVSYYSPHMVQADFQFLDSTFKTRAQTEQILRPYLEAGALTERDFQTAVVFLPGNHRYWPVRVISSRSPRANKSSTGRPCSNHLPLQVSWIIFPFFSSLLSFLVSSLILSLATAGVGCDGHGTTPSSETHSVTR